MEQTVEEAILSAAGAVDRWSFIHFQRRNIGHLRCGQTVEFFHGHFRSCAGFG